MLFPLAGFPTRWISLHPRGPGADSGINGGIDQAMCGAGHVTFYVEMPDLEATLSKIDALGGSTVTEPTQVPDGPTTQCSQAPRATLWVSLRPTLRVCVVRHRIDWRTWLQRF